MDPREVIHNMSIDTDTQHQAAASLQVVVRGLSSRFHSTKAKT